MKRIGLLSGWILFCCSLPGAAPCQKRAPLLTYHGVADSRPSTQVGPPLTDSQKTQAWSAYRTALQRTCAVQHLHLLSPAAMNLQVEEFEGELTPAQNLRFDQLAAESCKESVAGAACGNTAMLAAAVEGKFLDRLVAKECDTGIRCSAQSVCRVP